MEEGEVFMWCLGGFGVSLGPLQLLPAPAVPAGCRRCASGGLAAAPRSAWCPWGNGSQDWSHEPGMGLGGAGASDGHTLGLGRSPGAAGWVDMAHPEGWTDWHGSSRGMEEGTWLIPRNGWMDTAHSLSSHRTSNFIPSLGPPWPCKWFPFPAHPCLMGVGGRVWGQCGDTS